MKRLHFGLILVIVGIFSLQVASGQSSQPVLVDELGLHPCEDFASRIDGWIQESQRRSDLVPYAIVTGPANDLLKRITYREWIKGQLTWRFADKASRERFRILEGSLTDRPRVELWFASPGDNSLLQREARWDLSLSIKKAVPYYQSQGDGGICPHIDHAAVFKQLLAANPSLNGRVVFHEKNAGRFARSMGEFLAVRPDVATSRLSFTRPRKTDSFYDRHVEYWFVPGKRRPGS